MSQAKFDEECNYVDICKESYSDKVGFVCSGPESCDHFDYFLEGEITVSEWDGVE